MVVLSCILTDEELVSSSGQDQLIAKNKTPQASLKGEKGGQRSISGTHGQEIVQPHRHWNEEPEKAIRSKGSFLWACLASCLAAVCMPPAPHLLPQHTGNCFAWPPTQGTNRGCSDFPCSDSRCLEESSWPVWSGKCKPLVGSGVA